MQTTIVNFYGGPGCGKSTLAAITFATLKQAGQSVELVREYVKSWAWRGEKISTWDEPYLLAKQLRAESTLYGKVRYIVTDRPLGLSSVYERLYNPDSNLMRDMLKSLHRSQAAAGIDNVDLLVRRTKAYVQAGRYEDEDAARAIDALCPGVPIYSLGEVFSALGLPTPAVLIK